MRKGFIAIILLLITLVLVACGSITELKIEGSTVLEIGFNEEYKVFEGDKEIPSDDILWTVSDRSVIVTNENTIIPLKEGESDLIAVTRDGTKVAKITIKVVEAFIKSVTITSQEGDVVYLDDDSFLNLEYICDPVDQTVPAEWYSSDETIATVDEYGLVEPISKGSVTIYAKCGKAIGSFDIKVKERITEIKANMPKNLVVGQGVELSFNIDDPVVQIKDDDKNETSEIIGNVLFAKKVGKIKLSVKSSSLPSLNKVFEIEVKENAANGYSVSNDEVTKQATKLASSLNDNQKIAQYILAQTRATDLKEDDDGVYYNDTDVRRKVYIADEWEGREFANFVISGVNFRDPLDSLAYFQSIAKYNAQMGGFVMMMNSTATTMSSTLSPQISNSGLGKLTKDEFYQYYSNLAKELKEFGVNLYFTYGYNILTDSYSNDVIMNNYYTQLMIKAFEDNGIMVGITFETVGSNEEQKNTLIQMVNNNVELIGIQENVTNFDGEKSLVQYLRETLGYKGLIFLNESLSVYYNGINEEYDLNAAKTELAESINQGVDLLICSAYINYSNWNSPGNNNFIFGAYDAMVEAYTNGLISKDAVNASMIRLIEKKIKYNIVEGITTVPSEKSNYAEYTKYVQSLYKKTYTISETYEALDKTKNTVIIGSTFRGYGEMGYPSTSLDFGKNLNAQLQKEGFANVTYLKDKGKTMDDELAALKEDDQVIIMIRDSLYSYSYKDGDGKAVYESFSWYDKIQDLYNRGVTNITIVVLSDVEIADNMSYLKNRICANYNYSQNFAELIDLVIDGK